MDTDHNNNYADIFSFWMENAPDPSSTNEWEEIVVEFEFDEIVESKYHDKPRKGISK